MTEYRGAPPLTRARHRAALLAASVHLGDAERAELSELRGEDLRLAMRELDASPAMSGWRIFGYGILAVLHREVAVVVNRSGTGCRMKWRFTSEKARTRLARAYPGI